MSKWGFPLSVGLLLIAAGTARADLTAYWPFQQGSGATAYDQSGGGYDGAITGAAWTNDGTRGWVLDFQDADYVNITDATGAFSAVNNAVTVSVWQYGDVTIQPQDDYLFEGQNSANQRRLGVHLPWSNSRIYWDAGGSAGSYNRIDKATTSASEYEGQWNHWAFTKHNTTGVMKMFLNGTQWHSGGGATWSMAGITNFKIGSNGAGTGNYDGMIDDFAIWNEELAPSQIELLADGTIDPGDWVPSKGYAPTVQSDNPMAYYRFDGDTGANGSQMTDVSGNARHGSYQNAVAIESDSPLTFGSSSAHFNGSNNRGAGTTDQPTTAVTVEAWAKSDTVNWNNTGMLVSKRDAFIIHPNSGTKTIRFYINPNFFGCQPQNLRGGRGLSDIWAESLFFS